MQSLFALIGYDCNGIVHDAGDHIMRTVRNEYAETALNIYRLYTDFYLNRVGIVETEMNGSTRSFRHKKHLISYPFEWTANMYKDAVLFHLKLFLELDRYGLTLKDALPSNILFDFAKPVFVDFLSIVQTERLREEEWLFKQSESGSNDARFTVFSKMFEPFMLIPFVAMVEGRYELGRRLLAEKACNCVNKVPSWRDIYPKSRRVLGARNVLRTIKRTAGSLLRGAGLRSAFRNSRPFSVFNQHLLLKKERKFQEFIEELLYTVSAADVTPRESSYAHYYKEKKENYDIHDQSQWEKKQKSIFDIISRLRPKRVLDLGANTGWFSLLAAQLGAEVIAVDVDESSIDSLYLLTKKESLAILPLVISFDHFTREIYGIEDEDPIYKDRDFKANPLFLAPTKRLRCDLVLCLGLLHHLVLGAGKEISNILDVLKKLTGKTLVIEYIDMDDVLIKNEPSFFRNLNKFSKNDYNLQRVIEAAVVKGFRLVDTLDSHPETRKLLVFEK